MRDGEVGRAIRALRHRRSWTQRELAAVAGVSQRTVSRIEREPVDRHTVDVLRRVAEAAGLTIRLEGRWRGGELARLLDADHAALQGRMKVLLECHGWIVAAEVTFNFYGDRGSYDLLAWHPATGTLLVVEIKTMIADVQGLLRGLDMKMRRGRETVRGLGWQPRVVIACLVVADESTARRRVRDHAALLASLSIRGRAAQAWLRNPAGQVPAGGGLLLFKMLSHSLGVSARRAGRQRVRPRKTVSRSKRPPKRSGTPAIPAYQPPRG